MQTDQNVKRENRSELSWLPELSVLLLASQRLRAVKPDQNSIDQNSIDSSCVTDKSSLSYPCFYSLVNIYATAPVQRRRKERTMGAVLRMIDVDTRAV